MIKYWTLKKKKQIDVIIIHQSLIYKGRIKAEELNHFVREIEKEVIPKNFFTIPFSYIKCIENQSNKNKINIYFGNDSEEDLTFDNDETKTEVFTFLKNSISELQYLKINPSIISYAKPQVFAILFTLGIFLWSLYYAIQIENGVEYELKGRAGIGAIIYSIGLLGIVKVSLIFLVLITIGAYALIKRVKTKSEVEQLKRMV